MQIKNLRIYLIFFIFSLGIVFFAIFAPRESPRQKHDYQFPVMSTWAALVFYSADQEAEKAAAIVRREWDKVNAVCNIFDPASEVAKINAAAANGTVEVEVSTDLAELLNLADAAWRQSRGAFDVTVKPLMELWGFHRKQASSPDAEAVRATLQRVGWDKLTWQPETRRLALPAGMKLDFGGIAKGWAVDRALEALRRESAVRDGLINLGGNLRTFGRRPGEQSAFTIGVTDPANPETTLGTLEIRDAAVASSGDYRRFILHEGVKYSHILDPRTGYPVHRLPGVTVCAPSAAMADWLSTAAGIEENLPLPPGCTLIALPEGEPPRFQGAPVLWRPRSE